MTQNQKIYEPKKLLIMKTQKTLSILLLVLGAMRLIAQNDIVLPLSVTADGPGTFLYQWYYNTDSSNTLGTPLIPGATSPTYTPAITGRFYYYCVITNECGSLASEVSGLHDIVVITGCNFATPGFKGGTLGTVTYGDASNTDITVGTTTIVGSNGTTQTWSAHVFAAGCEKNDYDGGAVSNYNTDCRKSSDASRNYTGYGDLFSWCAVVKHRDMLCPEPWRVPTKEEFVSLDKALGGTGEDRTTDVPSGVRAKYVAASGAQGWAGAWGSSCSVTGALVNQGTYLRYWSSTEYDATYAFLLNVNSGSNIDPQLSNGKNFGFALRCVK
jgi:uncharacterized protein (TIGR02145 family)